MDTNSLSHTKWSCQCHIGIHTQIPKRGGVWESEGRYERDIVNTMSIQKGRDSRRCSMFRPCTSLCKYPTPNMYFRIFWIFEKKISTNET